MATKSVTFQKVCGPDDQGSMGTMNCATFRNKQTGKFGVAVLFSGEATEITVYHVADEVFDTIAEAEARVDELAASGAFDVLCEGAVNGIAGPLGKPN